MLCRALSSCAWRALWSLGVFPLAISAQCIHVVFAIPVVHDHRESTRNKNTALAAAVGTLMMTKRVCFEALCLSLPPPPAHPTPPAPLPKHVLLLFFFSPSFRLFSLSNYFTVLLTSRNDYRASRPREQSRKSGHLSPQRATIHRQVLAHHRHIVPVRTRSGDRRVNVYFHGFRAAHFSSNRLAKILETVYARGAALSNVKGRVGCTNEFE